jgi:hypothetical protein
MSEINEMNNGVGINAFIQQTTSDMTAISEQILHDCPYTACKGKQLKAEGKQLKAENERMKELLLTNGFDNDGNPVRYNIS